MCPLFNKPLSMSLASTIFISQTLKPKVRPAFFYTKAFDYISMAICLIMTKLLYYTVRGPLIYCVKSQRRLLRSFLDAVVFLIYLF